MLVGPNLRGGLTRAQWVTGNNPVVPYPIEKLDVAPYKVDASYTRSALIEVALLPRRNASGWRRVCCWASRQRRNRSCRARHRPRPGDVALMARRPTRSLPRSCEDARLLASLELDGELGELGALQLRRHLARCPECATWVAEMAAVTSLLRETPFEPVPTGKAPPTPPKADPPCSWLASGARGENSRRVLPRVVP